MYSVTIQYADGTSTTERMGWGPLYKLLRAQQANPDPNMVSIRTQRLVRPLGGVDEVAAECSAQLA